MATPVYYYQRHESCRLGNHKQSRRDCVLSKFILDDRVRRYPSESATKRESTSMVSKTKGGESRAVSSTMAPPVVAEYGAIGVPVPAGKHRRKAKWVARGDPVWQNVPNSSMPNVGTFVSRCRQECTKRRSRSRESRVPMARRTPQSSPDDLSDFMRGVRH